MLKELEINRIIFNPNQPRKKFVQEELEELAQSLLSVGFIHPPLVAISKKPGYFDLIAGERRVRAASLAGFTSIPVIIKESTFLQQKEAALIENIQRQDLNPIEIAKALEEMLLHYDMKQDELAKRLGKKRSTLSNYLRLNTLSVEIQEGLIEGALTFGHAKVLLSLKDKDRQHLLYESTIKKGLSVRQLEELAKVIEKKKGRKLSDPNLRDLQERLQEKLQTKVSLSGKGKKGTITISYDNLDDLDRVLSLLGINEN